MQYKIKLLNCYNYCFFLKTISTSRPEILAHAFSFFDLMRKYKLNVKI